LRPSWRLWSALKAPGVPSSVTNRFPDAKSPLAYDPVHDPTVLRSILCTQQEIAWLQAQAIRYLGTAGLCSLVQDSESSSPPSAPSSKPAMSNYLWGSKVSSLQHAETDWVAESRFGPSALIGNRPAISMSAEGHPAESEVVPPNPNMSDITRLPGLQEGQSTLAHQEEELESRMCQLCSTMQLPPLQGQSSQNCQATRLQFQRLGKSKGSVDTLDHQYLTAEEEVSLELSCNLQCHVRGPPDAGLTSWSLHPVHLPGSKAALSAPITRISSSCLNRPSHQTYVLHDWFQPQLMI